MEIKNVADNLKKVYICSKTIFIHLFIYTLKEYF